MRQIIIYYSLGGNTEYIVKKMEEEQQVDTLCLETKKAYPKNGPGKFLACGGSALLGKLPELNDYDVPLEDYDCIILGCPVWAGKIASPMASFLKKQQLRGKRVKLFLCHADEKDEKPMKTFVEAVEGNEVVGTAAFTDPLKNRQKVKEEEIQAFVARK